MENNKKNIDKILELLEERYRGAGTELEHKNPFQLLIATILSAQCTDKQVNKVTPSLLKISWSEDFAALEPEELEPHIKVVVFIRPSRNIVATCKILMEKYNGQVQGYRYPSKITRGGRKTANVVAKLLVLMLLLWILMFLGYPTG